jgi:hypothetical protein
MKSRVAQGAVFLAIGLALIALAMSPEVRAGIAQSAQLIGLSVILLVGGFWQLMSARKFADEIAEKMADASALRRLWLPAGFYSKQILLWQFRIVSAAMIGMALLIASLAYRHLL